MVLYSRAWNGLPKPARRDPIHHRSFRRIVAAHDSRSRTAIFGPDDKRPVILFDGVCVLCNGAVDFVLDLERWTNQREGAVRFAALQSQVGRKLLTDCGRDEDDISTIVLVEEQKHYIKSDAVLRIAQLLGEPLRVLGTIGLVFPRPLRDVVYDLVANNRYHLLGRRQTCRMKDDKYTDRFLL